MNIFKRRFAAGDPVIQCPRCLGKGQVDDDDIRRLKKELFWVPGTCAYCNGSGKIKPEVMEHVPEDAGFLVIDLPEEERKKMLNGHPDALERGWQFEENAEHFISEINYLHFEGGLQPVQIAGFYLIGKEGSGTYEAEKKDLIDYIEKVIKYKTDNR